MLSDTVSGKKKAHFVYNPLRLLFILPVTALSLNTGPISAIVVTISHLDTEIWGNMVQDQNYHSVPLTDQSVE